MEVNETEEILVKLMIFDCLTVWQAYSDFSISFIVHNIFGKYCSHVIYI